jgi:hypothetical protein
VGSRLTKHTTLPLIYHIIHQITQRSRTVHVLATWKQATFDITTATTITATAHACMYMMTLRCYCLLAQNCYQKWSLAVLHHCVLMSAAAAAVVILVCCCSDQSIYTTVYCTTVCLSACTAMLHFHLKIRPYTDKYMSPCITVSHRTHVSIP